ncbi:YhcN/YlaJ family sporulation lipoprotein [Brevibacillus dissolubilis]|uniref:YhcN/YlaJ family sporulation lipoprotein n=1 Tax=Brevibacillus dissolubilis TaxID=1844116 RepID=UPI001116B7F2|nr:YhcN/YlaJ family sporulation lipoprotein [Brevibacillus dissolubilis]
MKKWLYPLSCLTIVTMLSACGQSPDSATGPAIGPHTTNTLHQAERIDGRERHNPGFPFTTGATRPFGRDIDGPRLSSRADYADEFSAGTATSENMETVNSYGENNNRRTNRIYDRNGVGYRESYRGAGMAGTAGAGAVGYGAGTAGTNGAYNGYGTGTAGTNGAYNGYGGTGTTGYNRTYNGYGTGTNYGDGALFGVPGNNGTGTYGPTGFGNRIFGNRYNTTTNQTNNAGTNNGNNGTAGNTTLTRSSDMNGTFGTTTPGMNKVPTLYGSNGIYGVYGTNGVTNMGQLYAYSHYNSINPAVSDLRIHGNKKTGNADRTTQTSDNTTNNQNQTSTTTNQTTRTTGTTAPGTFPRRGYNHQVAALMAQVADSIPGVEGATALVKGGDAVVGVNTRMAPGDTEQRRVVERQVYEAIRAQTPGYRLHITSDNNIINRIRQLDTRANLNTYGNAYPGSYNYSYQNRDLPQMNTQFHR